jgi:hypothetical protein
MHRISHSIRSQVTYASYDGETIEGGKSINNLGFSLRNSVIAESTEKEQHDALVGLSRDYLS